MDREDIFVWREVCTTHDLWLEWRLNLAPLQPLPVDFAEERMVLDVALLRAYRAQSYADVLLEQRLETLERLLGQVVRVPWNFVTDRPEQLVFITTGERALADQHFVQQHAERPPVDRLIVV